LGRGHIAPSTSKRHGDVAPVAPSGGRSTIFLYFEASKQLILLDCYDNKIESPTHKDSSFKLKPLIGLFNMLEYVG